jgi:hypothetical protein
MQPFNNHSQQLPFRYFDSDMAKKRPLVVSFRRIQKMTPNNLDTCGSVSICDIHRLDTKVRDNNELMTMKIMSKYGANFSCSTNGRKGCQESQSYRNFPSMDKQRQLDSLFDENLYDGNVSDKGLVFPKEKFYGNAKLLVTVKDDMLRKAIVDDFDEDPYDRYISMKHKSHRRYFSSHIASTKEGAAKNDGEKPKFRSSQFETITSSASDNKMIDGAVKGCRATEVENHFLWGEEDIERRICEKMIAGKDKRQCLRFESRTNVRAFKGLPKSSSADIPLKKLSTFKEQSENGKAYGTMQKSVSMLSFI